MFFVLFSPRTFILDGVIPSIRGDQLVISTWTCGDCHSRNTRDMVNGVVLLELGYFFGINSFYGGHPLRSSNVLLTTV
jgi:hypothetical protein